MSTSRISEEQFVRLLKEGMPSTWVMNLQILTLEKGHAALRIVTGPDDVRPGNTVSGPTLFAIADLAMFAAVLSALGPVPMAVTTDATMHFLRKPRPGALVARARLLKEGKQLLVGDVLVSAEGAEDAPVMHAVMTYSAPPKSG